MKLTGRVLAGAGSKRQKEDFYATNPQSVRDLLDSCDFIEGSHFYEPCVGQGHIAEVIKEYFPHATVVGSDLVDRGYPNTIVADFVNRSLFDDGGEIPTTTDWIITNPPYKYAREFIDRSLSIATKGVAMFLKIQFLEGQSRKAWFKKNPPKYVYVFSARQQPMRDGLEKNPDTGKEWSNTMCFAWFVWIKGFSGEPTIRWI